MRKKWSKLKNPRGFCKTPWGFSNPHKVFPPHFNIGEKPWGGGGGGGYKKINIKNLSRNKYVWLYSVKKINIRL